eukprot:2360165-Prorocentrum_lima.AAC.1
MQGKSFSRAGRRRRWRCGRSSQAIGPPLRHRGQTTLVTLRGNGPDVSNAEPTNSPSVRRRHSRPSPLSRPPPSSTA